MSDRYSHPTARVRVTRRLVAFALALFGFGLGVVLVAGSTLYAQTVATEEQSSWWERVTTQLTAVWEVARDTNAQVWDGAAWQFAQVGGATTELPAGNETSAPATQTTLTASPRVAGTLVINTPLRTTERTTLATTSVTGLFTAPVMVADTLTVSGTADMQTLTVAAAANLGSLQVQGQGTLQNLTVADSANLSNLEVAASTTLANLTVSDQSTLTGRLRAVGGIVTDGSDVDLGDGSLFASNVVNAITAGERIRITGTPNNPTIAVDTDGLLGVQSLNDETGVLELEEGRDIRINGLEIENRSSLSSVRSRGGCAGCITDSDVRNDLTIAGGRIENTRIGSSTPASGRFTTLRVGTSTSSTTLDVQGGAAVSDILTVGGAATSTFGGTINLTSGCFAINGTCVGGLTPPSYVSLADTPNSLIATALPFANASGTALSQSSDLVFDGTHFGIGTSTPSSRLTVAGDAYITGALRDSSNTTGSNGYVLQTTGTSTAWVATSTLGFAAAGSSITTFLGLSDTPASFTANRIPFTNGAGDALIDSANLTFDDTALTVGGNILPGSNLTYDLGSSTGRFANVWAETLNIGTSTWSIWNGADDRLAFSNQAEQGGAEALTILNGGNVGIGTSTPSAILSVVGDTFLDGALRVTSATTSQFAGGINVTDGCVAVDGVCIDTVDTYVGLSDTPNSLIATALPFANASGTALSQSSDLVFDGAQLSVGTDTPRSRLTVDGTVSVLGQQAVQWYDADSSASVGFQAPANLATSTLWTLPSEDGTSNQILVTDGSGNLDFADISAIGSGASTYLELLDTPAAYATGTIPYVNATSSNLVQSSNFVYQENRLGLGVSEPTATLSLEGDVRWQQAGGLLGLSYGAVGNRFGFGTDNPVDMVTIQGSLTQRGGASGSTYSPIVRASLPLPTNANDIAIIGNYAYVVTNSSGNDFHVIDITDPDNPVEVGSLDLPNSATALTVQGQYAYVTTEFSASGFHVIDVSNPLNPNEVAALDIPTTAQAIEVLGRYAFVGVGSNVRIIDVSNPLSPDEVSAVPLSDVVNGLAVQGDYIYVTSAISGDDFHVIDASDPLNPTEIGSANLPDTVNDVTVRGSYAYIVSNSDGDDFHVIDISNPLNPTEVAGNNLVSAANAVFITGRYAYVVTQGSGNDFHVIDIRDPLTPTEIGSADPASGNGLGLAVAGRYAYMVSSNTGDELHVIDISGAELQSAIVHSLEGGSLTVQGDSRFGGRLVAGLGIRAGAEGVQTDGALSILGPTPSYIAGGLGIGTSSVSAELTVDGTVQSTDLQGGATNLTTDASGNIIRDPSDARLKTNISDLDNALELILDLRGVRYEWIDTNRFGSQTEIGFLAQEVDRVIPEVVRRGGEYWSLNTRNLIAVVVEAMQELWAELRGTQTEVERLEERVAELETQVNTAERATTDTSVSDDPVSDDLDTGGDTSSNTTDTEATSGYSESNATTTASSTVTATTVVATTTQPVASSTSPVNNLASTSASSTEGSTVPGSVPNLDTEQIDSNDTATKTNTQATTSSTSVPTLGGDTTIPTVGPTERATSSDNISTPTYEETSTTTSSDN